MDDERPVYSGLFVYWLLVACFAEAERAILFCALFQPKKNRHGCPRRFHGKKRPAEPDDMI
ncbi:hypothetical protein DXT94_30760 [Rhizobium sp. ICMP 5592]|nr:hypothetical protein [Rhizobium sp. ICMP 5592]